MKYLCTNKEKANVTHPAVQYGVTRKIPEEKDILASSTPASNKVSIVSYSKSEDEVPSF